MAKEFMDICAILMPAKNQVMRSAEGAVARNPLLNSPAVRAAEHFLSSTETDGELRAAIDPFKKWAPDEVLGVHFLNGNAQSKKVFAEYAEEWLKVSDATLKFNFDQPKSRAQIRVLFRSRGHSSALGTDCLHTPKSRPTMQFGWDPATYSHKAEVKRVILHEVGHALGFIHEHQRPDTRKEVKFDVHKLNQFFGKSPNYWSPATVKAQILDQYDIPLSTNATEFDRKSIMAYFIPPEATKDGKGIPPNKELSKNDIKLMRRIYGKPESGGGGTTVNDKVVTLTVDAAKPKKIKIGPGQTRICKFEITKTRFYTVRTHGNFFTELDVHGPNDQDKFYRAGSIDLDSFNAVATPSLSPGTWYALVKLKDKTLSGEVGVSVKEM